DALDEGRAAEDRDELAGGRIAPKHINRAAAAAGGAIAADIDELAIWTEREAICAGHAGDRAGTWSWEAVVTIAVLQLVKEREQTGAGVAAVGPYRAAELGCYIDIFAVRADVDPNRAVEVDRIGERLNRGGADLAGDGIAREDVQAIGVIADDI